MTSGNALSKAPQKLFIVPNFSISPSLSELPEAIEVHVAYRYNIQLMKFR